MEHRQKGPIAYEVFWPSPFMLSRLLPDHFIFLDELLVNGFRFRLKRHERW
jgi:hypothetical protein